MRCKLHALDLGLFDGDSYGRGSGAAVVQDGTPKVRSEAVHWHALDPGLVNSNKGAPRPPPLSD